MIITVTITAWAQGHRGHAGGHDRRVTHHRDEPAPRPVRGRAPRRARAPPPGRGSSGSGRSHHHTHPAATSMPTQPDRERPGQLGHAQERGEPRPPPVRFGPATAPTVVAHTTTDRARARCSGGREVGRGVARPVVDRRGRSQHDRAEEQHGNESTTPATTDSTAPVAADQVARDQADTSAAAAHHAREPVRGDGRAEHLQVCARPAIVSLPEMSLARSEAIATPMVTPTPPTAWETTRVPDRTTLHLSHPVVGPPHPAGHPAGQAARRGCRHADPAADSASGRDLPRASGSGPAGSSLARRQLQGLPDRAPHALRRLPDARAPQRRCDHRGRTITCCSAQLRA